MYYIYVLRCRDGSLYSGITTDLSRRLRQHLGKIKGGAKYTKSHPPISIEGVWTAPSRASASRLEYYLHNAVRADKEKAVGNPVFLPKTQEEFLPLASDNPALISANKEFNPAD